MHCVGLQTRPQTGVRRVRLQLNRVTPRGSVRFFFFGITKRKEKRNVCQSDTQRSNMENPALRNHCVLPWRRRVAERVPGVYSYPHLS